MKATSYYRGISWDNTFVGQWTQWQSWQESDKVGVFQRERKWTPEEYNFTDDIEQKHCAGDTPLKFTNLCLKIAVCWSKSLKLSHDITIYNLTLSAFSNKFKLIMNTDFCNSQPSKV